MTQMNPFMRQKQNRRHGESTGGCKRWAFGGGMELEVGVSRCKLLYIEWTKQGPAV